MTGLFDVPLFDVPLFDVDVVVEPPVTPPTYGGGYAERKHALPSPVWIETFPLRNYQKLHGRFAQPIISRQKLKGIEIVNSLRINRQLDGKTASEISKNHELSGKISSESHSVQELSGKTLVEIEMKHSIEGKIACGLQTSQEIEGKTTEPIEARQKLQGKTVCPI